GSLLAGLPLAGASDASAPGPVSSLVGNLPGVPSLGGLADDVAGGLLSGDRSEHTTLPNGKGGGGVVLRLSLGELSPETTATGVHAKAASLRVKILTRSSYSPDGSTLADNTALVDLGLCVLEAAAAAPKPANDHTTRVGDGYGSGTGSGDNGGISGTTPT